MNEFEFKKSLGQNFIKDDNIIDKIVKYSEIDKDTLVIEIGPGAGSLSKKIVPLSGYSILYEIDKRLENILNNLLKDNNNYEIIFDDFLIQDISYIRNKYNHKKIFVIANLPYYITTPIITKLVDELYPDKIIIMIQEEVANRLAASSGTREYGMISVLLGSRYNIKKLFKVSRNCFIPVPNVDSAVISMEKFDRLGIIDKERFNRFIISYPNKYMDRVEKDIKKKLSDERISIEVYSRNSKTMSLRKKAIYNKVFCGKKRMKG